MREKTLMIPLLTRAVVGSVLLMALVSCASVSVRPGAESAASEKPQKIYVAAFDTTHGEFNVDREGAELTDFKHDLQLMLKTGIVTDLTKRLVYAVPTTQMPAASTQSAWLIRGELMKVNQGSRLLRSVVGFGAGGTKFETRVFVYDLANSTTVPFMTFSTTGGSGAEPGAIAAVTMDPLQLAIGGVSGIAHGLTEDAARTSRMITAQLSDYMYKRGWISKDQWIQPKTQSSNDGL